VPSVVNDEPEPGDSAQASQVFFYYFQLVLLDIKATVVVILSDRQIKQWVCQSYNNIL